VRLAQSRIEILVNHMLNQFRRKPLGCRVDRAKLGLLDARRILVDHLPFRLHHLRHISKTSHFPLHPDEHAGVDFPAKPAAIEPDQGEFFSPVVDRRFETRSRALADIIDRHHFAPAGLDLIRHQSGDRPLRTFELVVAREIFQQIAERGHAQRSKDFPARQADAGQ